MTVECEIAQGQDVCVGWEGVHACQRQWGEKHKRVTGMRTPLPNQALADSSKM